MVTRTIGSPAFLFAVGPALGCLETVRKTRQDSLTDSWLFLAHPGNARSFYLRPVSVPKTLNGIGQKSGRRAIHRTNSVASEPKLPAARTRSTEAGVAFTSRENAST